MEELNKLNESPIFREYMTYEEDQRKIFNSRMKAATEKGIEQGKMDVAKKLLKEEVDIGLISKVTGLLIEQVEKLKSN